MDPVALMVGHPSPGRRPRITLVFGKPPASPFSSLHERPPSVHESLEYGKVKSGKTKPDAHPSYLGEKENQSLKAAPNKWAVT